MPEINSEKTLREQIIDETDASFELALSAVADTWGFMTGQPMPDEVLEEAKERCKDRAPDQLWRRKFQAQVINHPDLSSTFKRDAMEDLGARISDVQVDAAIRYGLAEEDVLVTELVTMLGDNILDTAYKCLGDDVDMLIAKTKEEVQSADSSVAKASALTRALTDRLFEMKETDHPAEALLKDEHGKQINHIAKLSPITIGRYPDTNFVPSCLAYSIISASFLKQCGVEQMIHAGAVSPVDRPYAITVNTVASAVDITFRAHQMPYNDNFQYSIGGIIRDSEKDSDDLDPHSAIFYKIDDEWVLYDPYQKLNLVLGSIASTRADLVYEKLEAHPALEYIHHPDEHKQHYDRAAYSRFVADIIIENAPSIDRWGQVLDVAVAFESTEPLFQELELLTGGRSDFVTMLRATKLFDQLMDRVLEDVTDPNEAAVIYTSEISLYLRSRYASYVFELEGNPTKEAIKKCLKRCETDDDYRGRLLENVHAFPYKLILILLQGYRNDLQNPEELRIRNPHDAVEARNIAHGIGAACLLDVSYGLGNSLPISFWGRQSSSQLPYLYASKTETFKTETEVGKKVANVIRKLIEVDDSHYSQLSGILVVP